MRHALVEKCLDDFSYRETVGEDALYDAFDEYLRQRNQTAAKVAVSDGTVSDFLEFLMSAQQGGWGGDGCIADDGERQLGGEREGEPAGYESPDYSYSGSESDGDGEGVDADGGHGGEVVVLESGSGVEEAEDGDGDAAMGDAAGVVSDSDVEVLEASGDEFEVEAIEDSSNDEQQGIMPGGARAPMRGTRLGSVPSRRQPSAAAAAAGGGGIGSFFQKLPRGVPSSAALAGPSQQQRQQQGAQALRPATAEEQQLDLLDYANQMVFGNAAFRSQQRQVIEAAMRGQDCFVLMPTGGGKSLTYQLPAVLTRGLTVVVTPLLSLMQDQVQALNGLACGGVPTSYLSSQQTVTESRAVFLELGKQRPTIKLLYVTPEQLVKGQRLKEALGALHRRGLLARIVIDEAHCVSAWGHDFRPDYKQVGVVTSGCFPGVPMMALTATATPKVRQDVMSTLRMRAPRQFEVSFFRPNLLFSVVQKDYTRSEESGLPGYLEEMMLYIQNHREGSGIVYCLSRDDTESVAGQIRDHTDISAAHYHAGMTPKQRMQVQNDWRTGRVQVVVATIAFGMGVDKADVRYVIHFTLSKSMEGYYQEAGRAGRDGLPSECLLYFSKRDVPRILQLLHYGARRSGKAAFQREVELLNQMRGYCEDGERCRHAQVLAYFGEAWQQGRCGDRCDVCCGGQQKQQQQQQKEGGGRRLASATAKRPGGGKAAAGFQSAATLLSSQQQGGSDGGQQRQQPAGSSRALKMQQAAVGAGGWHTKVGAKENPAAAAAGPAVFVTAYTLTKQQQQQQQPPGKAGAKKAGSKTAAAAPAKKLTALDRMLQMGRQ